ncbi:MAG: bifunctional nuclease family protein [Chloroflexi bacterium]|nr:bifunctional nuclease family protein [Chloroflexota bacterium]
MIELDIYSVLYSMLDRHRLVLLKETHGERYLPIWIGDFESEAIVMRLQNASVPRPLTHDLLLTAINELGGQLAYVVVNDFTESTYYARLALQKGGRLQMVDARPSDAMALALRAGVPLYADEGVMEKAAIAESAAIPLSAGQDDSLQLFRDFFDTLDDDHPEAH